MDRMYIGLCLFYTILFGDNRSLRFLAITSVIAFLFASNELILFQEEIMGKRKKLIALLLVVTLLCNVFLLTACNINNHTHNYSIEWAKDSVYHWQACSGCEETRNKAEHDWNAGIVTLQPTVTSEGAKTFTCNTCGQTKIESILMIEVHSHTFFDKGHTRFEE